MQRHTERARRIERGKILRFELQSRARHLRRDKRADPQLVPSLRHWSAESIAASHSRRLQHASISVDLKTRHLPTARVLDGDAVEFSERPQDAGYQRAVCHSRQREISRGGITLIEGIRSNGGR